MQNKELLEYFENVLGVRDILLPEKISRSSSAGPREAPGKNQVIADNFTGPVVASDVAKERVLFIFQSSTGQNDLPGPALELFEKMRAAMGLHANNTDMLFLSLEEDRITEWMNRMNQHPSLWSVSFSEPLSQKLIRKNPSLALRLKTTHDPRSLLEKPELKRSAWTDLQEVMREI